MAKELCMLSLDVIKQRLFVHEGFRSKPYRCTNGKLTIGIGHNIEDNPFTEEELRLVGKDYMEKGITKAQAFAILAKDIMKFDSELRQNIPFYERLDDERQYALLDMAFNMGIGSNKKGLLSFKKMLSYIGTGFYKQAAAECLDSKYGRELPKRAGRIAKTIETGVFKW